jgi:hypothetical protein
MIATNKYASGDVLFSVREVAGVVEPSGSIAERSLLLAIPKLKRGSSSSMASHCFAAHAILLVLSNTKSMEAVSIQRAVTSAARGSEIQEMEES